MPVPDEVMKALNKEEQEMKKLKMLNAEENFYFEQMLQKWIEEYNGEVDRLLEERDKGENNLTDEEINVAAIELVGEKPERPKGGTRRKTRKIRRTKKKSRKARKYSRKH
jgi:hypothetical protein